MREAENVRGVPAGYFSSDELRREAADFDLLILHSLMPEFAASLPLIHPRTTVVWCGWGFDYYVLIEHFLNLLRSTPRQ